MRMIRGVPFTSKVFHLSGFVIRVTYVDGAETLEPDIAFLYTSLPLYLRNKPPYVLGSGIPTPWAPPLVVPIEWENITIFVPLNLSIFIIVLWIS